jgi:hypothetical protein
MYVRVLSPAEHAGIEAGLRSSNTFTLRRSQILLASSQEHGPKKSLATKQCAMPFMLTCRRAWIVSSKNLPGHKPCKHSGARGSNRQTWHPHYSHVMRNKLVEELIITPCLRRCAAIRTISPNQKGVEGTGSDEVWMITVPSAILAICASLKKVFGLSFSKRHIFIFARYMLATRCASHGNNKFLHNI